MYRKTDFLYIKQGGVTPYMWHPNLLILLRLTFFIACNSFKPNFNLSTAIGRGININLLLHHCFIKSKAIQD